MEGHEEEEEEEEAEEDNKKSELTSKAKHNRLHVKKRGREEVRKLQTYRQKNERG